jgi:hypothetical protein
MSPVLALAGCAAQGIFFPHSSRRMFMGTTFAIGWDDYKNDGGENEAFTENNIRAALGKAWGNFLGYEGLLRSACDPGPFLVIETSVKQPEKNRLGLCVKFTGRYQGRAYSFYLEVDNTSNLVVFEITG